MDEFTIVNDVWKVGVAQYISLWSMQLLLSVHDIIRCILLCFQDEGLVGQVQLYTRILLSFRCFQFLSDSVLLISLFDSVLFCIDLLPKFKYTFINLDKMNIQYRVVNLQNVFTHTQMCKWNLFIQLDVTK